jgi:manganese transport protein
MCTAALWYCFGPAFVASIAYIDPGNFSVNIDVGAHFGYKLLWVLLWSNAMAILVQYLAAKLGIATALTLPQNCRLHFPRPVTIFLWIMAEISALATDLAEFLGAALGFYLLIGPRLMRHGWTKHHILLAAVVVSTVLVFAILAMEFWSFRSLEFAIMAFVCAIGACYTTEIFFVHPDWKQVAVHTVVPMLDGKSIYSAVAILGATLMPHVVCLHSALVQPRVQMDGFSKTAGGYLGRLSHLRFESIDIIVAMNGAWLVNSAMLIVAAAAFTGIASGEMSIEQAHKTLGPLLGSVSATVFAIALLCSGLSASTVGTMAGQVILEGFLEVRFNIFLRRLLTLLPAICIIALGFDPLKVLIWSQVMMSFTFPFILVPLLMLTGRESVMGRFVNKSWTSGLGWLTVTTIVGLNVFLLWRVWVA